MNETDRFERSGKMNILHFDRAISMQKPENIVHREEGCPFCHRETLENIVATEGDFILLRNKYNILVDADQFVLVETAGCEPDVPQYAPGYFAKLLQFGLAHWRRMEESGAYDAVLFFKNHGYLSGGTMRHPHMQIVGLRHVEHPALLFDKTTLAGETLLAQGGVLVNAATHPLIGHGEFNFIADDMTPATVETLAKHLQKMIAFVTKEFPKSQESYNLFFYHYGEKLVVKLIVRHPASPFLVGYGIRILPIHFPKMAEKLRRYLSES